MLAEFGQGLGSVLVQVGEHCECRVSEAAFWAFAAEAAVEAPDGGAYLAAEVGPLRLGRLLVSCILLHRSLMYLTKSFVYLNNYRRVPRSLRGAPCREAPGGPEEL